MEIDTLIQSSVYCAIISNQIYPTISLGVTLFIASYDMPVFDNLTTLIALVVLSALLIFTLIYLLYAFIASQSMRKEIIPLTLEK